jgi:hypothetical protein
MEEDDADELGNWIDKWTQWTDGLAVEESE